MKIFIGTLNGGGTETLLRLGKSIKEKIFESKHNIFDFQWNILVQGNKGCDLNILYKDINGDNIKHHILSQNVGVVKGTNHLIDSFMKTDCDIFWMIDDDILLIDDFFYHYMIKAIEINGFTTCCTEVAWFGNKKDINKNADKIISIPDCGSGCTMYKREVYENIGYYDPNIIQYGSDTDFNNRIKYVFGEKSLGLVKGEYTKHFNQTGTFNCYNRGQWSEILRKDQIYLKNKKYNDDNVYQE